MVIVRIWEGLGNQMFQYAYARALKERGADVRLDLEEAYGEIFTRVRNNAPRTCRIQNFRISIPPIHVREYGKYEYLSQDTIFREMAFWLGRHSLWKYKFYEEDSQMLYSKAKAGIKGNYYIKGWFQDERYFEKIRPVLLKEFTPRNKIAISGEIKKALENPQSVSVHVRRGDYVRLNWALKPLYYDNAVSNIRQIYAEPIFLVFSDDLEWTKKNIQINGKCIYVNENGHLEDYEELYVMSRCRANIIANSTFSWWAAWLNQNKEKVVIAPWTWKKERGYMIPDGWITV